MKIFGKTDTTINITTRTVVKSIALVMLAVVGLQVIGNISHQLHLIFISAFLAIALNPAVGWISHRLRSKSRIRATGIAYIIVIALLIGFLALIIPPLVRQTTDFAQGVPDTINNIKYQDTAISRTVRKYKLQDRIDDIRDDYANRIGDFSGPVVNTASRIGGSIISSIIVIVLTFMMLVEGPVWVNKALALQPEAKRKHRADIMRRMYRVVTGYVNGQFLIAAIAAIFAGIALFIMGSIFDAQINPIALAGIVFVLGLIPMIGNIMSAVIVVLACLLSSLPLAIGMGIFFLVYQQIENATLQPYIQSRNNQLTPLTVFIVALLGVGLAGIIGAIAAIPIAGCAKILLDEYLKVNFPNYQSIKDSK